MRGDSALKNIRKKAHGIIFIFDLTQPSSLKTLQEKRESMIRQGVDFNNVPCIVVGTKADLIKSRKVAWTDIQQVCDDWNIPYFETSAKNGTNIPEAYEELLSQVVKRRLPNSVLPRPIQQPCSSLNQEILTQ